MECEREREDKGGRERERVEEEIVRGEDRGNEKGERDLSSLGTGEILTDIYLATPLSGSERCWSLQPYPNLILGTADKRNWSRHSLSLQWREAGLQKPQHSLSKHMLYSIIHTTLCFN